MTKRSTAADFVTAFATGWPENQPEIMVLSLTTNKGVQDFALSKEQTLLIAKTMTQTRARLAAPKQGSEGNQSFGSDSIRTDQFWRRFSAIEAPLKPLSALIETDWWLPRVATDRLAVNPAALATTSKLPLAPRPWRVPVMPRLLSLHVPESTPRSETTLPLRSNL